MEFSFTSAYYECPDFFLLRFLPRRAYHVQKQFYILFSDACLQNYFSPFFFFDSEKYAPALRASVVFASTIFSYAYAEIAGRCRSAAHAALPRVLFNRYQQRDAELAALAKKKTQSLMQGAQRRHTAGSLYASAPRCCTPRAAAVFGSAHAERYRPPFPDAVFRRVDMSNATLSVYIRSRTLLKSLFSAHLSRRLIS